MFILSKKTIKFLISPIKEPSSTNNITMPITTDYDTFAQRYHGESPEIKKLKAENGELKERLSVKTTQWEAGLMVNEKLKAENEQLNDDDWVIDCHKALKYKIVLTEEYYAEITALNEKLEADNEKLFKFITGGGEVSDVEEIIVEKMSKEFIDGNQEHWDQMELFQEEGSDNVIDTLKAEVDLLQGHIEEYRCEVEYALAGTAPLTMYSDDFTDWENHPFLKHKVVLTKEENEKLKEEIVYLKEKISFGKYNRDDDKVMMKAYEEEIKKLTAENEKIKGKDYPYKIGKLEAKNKFFKEELEKLMKLTKDTATFWQCLMDCRGNPDNPDKQEIDEWCDSYKQSDEVRLSLYEDSGVDEDEWGVDE